jgi:FkbM family methyltransferase
VLSLFKKKLLKPFFALTEQLRQTQQGISDELRRAQEWIGDQTRQTQQGISDQLRQTQQGINDQLHQMQLDVGSLAAEFGALRRRTDGVLVPLGDLKQFLASEQTRRDARELEIQQQLAALLMRKTADGKDRGEAYYQYLHAVGVLNYENATVSGERRFLTRFLEQYPTALVLDVGANTGQYSELVRELGPATVVHAFEPHPVSFADLEKLADRIGVTAHPFALGEARAEIEIFDYTDEAGSQHASLYREVIENVHRRPAAAWKVRCETLDAVAEKLNLMRIGLLKIDTEGHELAVLKGARRLLETGAIDVIQFEFNEMNVISRVFMRDFFALLSNYRIHRLLGDGAIEFQTYDPTFMEVFAYQNMACIRRDLDPFWIHGG